jgi:hypothetical protein
MLSESGSILGEWEAVSFERNSQNGQTLDVEESGEIGGACRIFGHARVLAHVACVHRLNGQSADFAAYLADDNFVSAFNFRLIEKPDDCNWRVSFCNGAYC